MNENTIHLRTISDLFALTFHEGPIQLTQLKGDASDRTLYRVKSMHHQVIGVFGPNPEENRAFFHFSEAFRKNNIPVPEIYSIHSNSKYYVMEDLGDITLFQHLQDLRKLHKSFPIEAIEPLYNNIIETLIKIQIQTKNDIDFSICYQTKVFDEGAWKIDQHNFIEFFLKNLLETVDITKLNVEFEQLNKRLKQCSQDFFLYRDFQSRNMMLHSNRIVFIDYQSGRLGALAYDIASLLYDARADIPAEYRIRWFNEYLNKLKEWVEETRVMEVRQTFDYYAILRILQALGSYGKNGIVRQKKEHLLSIPYALHNVIQLLEKVSHTLPLETLYKSVLWIHSSKTWEKWM